MDELTAYLNMQDGACPDTDLSERELLDIEVERKMLNAMSQTNTTTTTKETTMETTTLTENETYTALTENTEWKEHLLLIMEMSREELLVNYLELCKATDTMAAKIGEQERKMANAAKNYAKLADRCRAAEARLKQQPQGMVAAPAPPSSQARREAYQAHLATVLPIGPPCSRAHCPTCNQTQPTNNKGRCIPCSNAAVKTFYAKR